MRLKPTPPLSGRGLKVLVALAESPFLRSGVYALMLKSMGITELLLEPLRDEPLPLDYRPLVTMDRERTR